MFNRIKQSLGIDSITVDTTLQSNRFTQGDVVEGTVYVRGGTASQNINKIVLKLYMTKLVPSKNGYVTQKFVFEELKITEAFQIQAWEEKSFPFTLALPYHTPLTTFERRRTDVWIKTEVDVPYALDSKDRDDLEIVPHRCTEEVLSAMDLLSFYFSEVQTIHQHEYRQLPYRQVFQYIPQGEDLKKWDDLWLDMILTPEMVTIRMQLFDQVKDLPGYMSRAFLIQEGTKLNITYRLDEVTKEKVAADIRAMLDRLLENEPIKRST
jgi:sporulation-control protein